MVASVVGGPAELNAQSGEDPEPIFTQGTRALGLGTAFGAVATGADGIYHNPAGIATARMYAIDAGLEHNASNTLLNASVVDSQTNPRLAMGVGYTYLLPRDSNVKGHDIRLAASVPAVQDRVSVGLGGRYLILSRQDGVEYARGFTLDGGILVQPAGELRLGLTGKNVINVCRKPEVCSGVTPRLLELGTAYGDPTEFTIAADVGSNLSEGDDPLSMRVDVGAEYMIQGMVPVRAGYRWRQLEELHTVTVGSGWRSKGFGLDVGVALPPARLDEFQLSAGFELYFN